jgi:hypothetical protein
VNLLELKDIISVLKKIKMETKSKELSIKEKSVIAVDLFNAMAEERDIKLELIK